uniref:Uncharacterized protein n=1 Tax=Populus trichocarpa TaxID=3694 RepID=A0A3N7F9S4_POPTR
MSWQRRPKWYHIGSLGTITRTAGLYLNENAVSSSGAWKKVTRADS